MPRPTIVIVTPFLADANNGNWRTAGRWAAMLGAVGRVQVVTDWRGGDEALMVALHARRSAAAVAAWRAARARRPLLLALTGTDLYRDIDGDPDAQRSLQAADALVVLNALGCERLPAGLRSRCHTVLQSCALRRTLPKTPRHLRALVVAHLRQEKDPRTWFRAAERLVRREDILLDHAGAALDPVLGADAQGLALRQPRYRWLGPVSHAEARRRIQAAHVLVHPSRLEGGAHVVIEAIRSGTPVIASRIDGNVGLLGDDYGGYFPPGDDAALAALLERARDDAAMLPALLRQTAARAPLFAPEIEATTLRRLVAGLLERAPDGDPG